MDVPSTPTKEHLVEDADGKVGLRARRDLRHRLEVQECHASVSNDKKHGSYAMRKYVSNAISKLQSWGILNDQALDMLCIHSDNASQHFKSSKSIKWVSDLRSLFGEEQDDGALAKFSSVTWNFGPPGHDASLFSSSF